MGTTFTIVGPEYRRGTSSRRRVSAKAAHGGGDRFDGPDIDDDRERHGVNDPYTNSSYNTTTSAMLTAAGNVPKPLVRFLAWHRLMPHLAPLAVMFPKARVAKPSLLCICDSPPVSDRAYAVRILGIDGNRVQEVRSCKTHLFVTLLRAGTFPASPILPRVAIDIAVLRMYAATSDWSNVSAFGYAHALLDVSEAMFYNDGIRKLLQSFSLWYSAMHHYWREADTNGHLQWSAGRPLVQHEDLRLSFAELLRRCPASFFSPSDEGQQDSKLAYPPQHPQLIVAIDGNFTQRRLANGDLIQRSALPPAFFLSPQQVDHVKQMMRRPGVNSDQDEQGDDLNEDSDPSAASNHPQWHACTSNVLGAHEKAAKGAAGPCDITGVMGLCCRHDVPLIFCDIDTPGEQHHYAIALVKHLVDAVPNLSRVGILYDIGCRFPAKKNIDKLIRAQITWAVSVFHVFGHSYQCSPRRKLGFGWSDGEGMERIWSALSTLIVAARSMSHGDRRQTLEQRLQHRVRQAQSGLLHALKARSASLYGIKKDAHDILQSRVTRAIILPRYEAMHLARRSFWVMSAAHAGLDRRICHVLSRMAALRRRKVSLPLPAEADVSLHQRLSVQLLALLGSIRQGHQQVQGRHNRGQRGNAMIRNINKSLTKAKADAYALLPRFNDAVRDRTRSRLDPFVSLSRDSLLTDAAYRWVARETQQYSGWWANTIASAAIDAYEELERVHEEELRVQLEVRSALLWLNDLFGRSFSPTSTSPLSTRLDLARLYLAWYPPHARKSLSPPSAHTKFPWSLPLPLGAQEMVRDAVKILPRNVEYTSDDETDLALEAEAGELIKEGLIVASTVVA